MSFIKIFLLCCGTFSGFLNATEIPNLSQPKPLKPLVFLDPDIVVVNSNQGLQELIKNPEQKNKIVKLVINHITEIPNDSFRECKNLEVVYSVYVTTIKPWAFYNCPKLQSVFMTKVKSIGEYAFTQCSNLRSLEIPNVETIHEKAFSHCPQLNNVKIPNIKIIDSFAFSNCLALNDIEFPETTRIANTAFFLCPFQLKKQPDQHKITEMRSLAPWLKLEGRSVFPLPTYFNNTNLHPYLFRPTEQPNQQPKSSADQQHKSSSDQQHKTSSDQHPKSSADQQHKSSVDQQPKSSADQQHKSSADQQPKFFVDWDQDRSPKQWREIAEQACQRFLEYSRFHPDVTSKDPTMRQMGRDINSAFFMSISRPADTEIDNVLKGIVLIEENLAPWRIIDCRSLIEGLNLTEEDRQQLKDLLICPDEKYLSFIKSFDFPFSETCSEDFKQKIRKDLSSNPQNPFTREVVIGLIALTKCKFPVHLKVIEECYEKDYIVFSP